MTEKLYTQQEVDTLRQAWESDLFEQKTNAAMARIETRLDTSNAYKETFGKDLTDIKSDVKDVKNRVLTLENDKLREERNRKEAELKHHQWYQDRHVRLIGYSGIVLWFLTLLHGSGILSSIGHLVGL